MGLAFETQGAPVLQAATIHAQLNLRTGCPQILGLTNYSAWPEHALGRECIAEDAASQEALGAVALRRLVNMKHVGLTERLDESVASLAATLGALRASPRTASVWGVCDATPMPTIPLATHLPKRPLIQTPHTYPHTTLPLSGFKLKSIAYDFTSRQAFSFEGEGRDLSQPITYNSSYHRANETVPIAEARRRLVAMSARRSKLAEDLRVCVYAFVGGWK